MRPEMNVPSRVTVATPVWRAVAYQIFCYGDRAMSRDEWEAGLKEIRELWRTLTDTEFTKARELAAKWFTERQLRIIAGRCASYRAERGDRMMTEEQATAMLRDLERACIEQERIPISLPKDGCYLMRAPIGFFRWRLPVKEAFRVLGHDMGYEAVPQRNTYRICMRCGNCSAMILVTAWLDHKPPCVIVDAIELG